jgi:MFS family permease
MALRGISRNVLTLGWVSLLNDLASEMLYPVMPLFVIGTLGATPPILGLIDGLAEGIGSGLRWLGGTLSDRFQRRKPFILLGYLVSALSKPVMGLSQVRIGWPLYGAGRISDRFGKSIRNSARDALISESTEEAHRGRAFGFQRAMDTCGAVLGPLVTLLIIGCLAGFHTAFSAHWTGNGGTGHGDAGSARIARLPLKWLFYFAVIPGLIATGLIAVSVTEIRPKRKTGAGPPPIFQSFPKPFGSLVLANAVFALGNSSDSFLFLRSGELGLGFGSIILAYVIYNVIYAAASTPLGNLSDRVGRKPMIAAGWGIYAVVYGGFAFWHSAMAPWILLPIYGFYPALTDGVGKAMVADIVPSEKRAGAIGLFDTVGGLGTFLASLLAGALWAYRPGGIIFAMGMGGVLALLAAILMLRVKQPSAIAKST